MGKITSDAEAAVLRDIGFVLDWLGSEVLFAGNRAHFLAQVPADESQRLAEKSVVLGASIAFDRGQKPDARLAALDALLDRVLQSPEGRKALEIAQADLDEQRAADERQDREERAAELLRFGRAVSNGYRAAA